jgi:uncharacterized protein (DUF488 family)
VAHRLHTIGYEGTTPTELVADLAVAGVDVVVDVRLNAVSRRPGFSKRKLAEALGEANIEYVNERALGNPTDNRDAFRRGHAAARARLRHRIEREGAEALDRVAELVADRSVALLCVEANHVGCHRELVADLLVERDPTLVVVHL